MPPPSTGAAQLKVRVIGGIGSGKSTVTGVFGRLGASVVSADLIGHVVVERGGRAYESVASRWPTVVVDGDIDRAQLARIVFHDEAQLRELEAITHPHIAEEIAARVAAVAPEAVVVELPVLYPLPGYSWVTVVVDANPVIRLRRLLAMGADEDDVAARIAVQPARDAWLAAADHVIVNEGTIQDLVREAEELWAHIVRRHRG